MATPPAPHYFTFVDEIELIGQLPADPNSVVPILPAIKASGAKQLQQVLAGGNRAANLMEQLSAPILEHGANWPEPQQQAQRQQVQTLRTRAKTETDAFAVLREELTAEHREHAQRVYAADTLVWEVAADEPITMLSLPAAVHPAPSASVHTVINALEVTALGVANLSGATAPLTVNVSGGGEHAPAVTAALAAIEK